MIAITVQRPPADRQGPDISDPLITSDLAARERGRVEIDRGCTNRALVSLSGPYRRFVAPGTLVDVSGRRERWRGVVRRSSITISRSGETFQADQALELERVL